MSEDKEKERLIKQYRNIEGRLHEVMWSFAAQYDEIRQILERIKRYSDGVSVRTILRGISVNNDLISKEELKLVIEVIKKWIGVIEENEPSHDRFCNAVWNLLGDFDDMISHHTHKNKWRPPRKRRRDWLKGYVRYKNCIDEKYQGKKIK